MLAFNAVIIVVNHILRNLIRKNKYSPKYKQYNIIICTYIILINLKFISDHNTLKNVLNTFIISHGEAKLISYIERDLNTFSNLNNINSILNNKKSLILEYTVSILINWLNQLIATLECYTLLYKENMIDIKLLKNPCSR